MEASGSSLPRNTQLRAQTEKSPEDDAFRALYFQAIRLQWFCCSQIVANTLRVSRFVSLIVVVVVDHDFGEAQGDRLHWIALTISRYGIAANQNVFQCVSHELNNFICTSLNKLDGHFLTA